MILLRRPAAWVVLLAGLAVAGVVAYSLAAKAPPKTGDGGDVIRVEVSYAFEPNDKRQLVGFATNVFAGRVVAKVGSDGAPLSGPGDEVVPRTQFSVAVLKNIKGDLGGTVTVSQTGGYDGGQKVFIEGDALLEPGQEYLFATVYDRDEGWHAIAAQPFGSVPVGDERQRAALVEGFEQAHEEQIRFDPSAP